LNTNLWGIAALGVIVGFGGGCGGSSGGSDSGNGEGKNDSSSGGTSSSHSSEGGSASGGSKSGGSTSNSSGSTGSANSSAVACDQSNIVGTWEAAGTGALSVLVTFTSGGVETVEFFAAGASAGTYDEEEAIGTYTVSGSLLTFTPTAISCPTPASAGIDNCVLADGDLFSTNASGTTTVFAPAAPSSIDQSLITLGCFDNPFVPYPLTSAP
jgi:hypothetical protein